VPAPELVANVRGRGWWAAHARSQGRLGL